MQRTAPPSHGIDRSRTCTKPKRKEFGARCVEAKEPRSKLYLVCVIVIYLVVMSLVLCYYGVPFEEQYMQFGVGVFTALFYFICAKEIYIEGRKLMTGFSFNRSVKDQVVFMGLIPSVAVVVFYSDKPVNHQILESVCLVALVSILVAIFFLSKVNRNKADSTRILERMPVVVGPGLAKTFSRYLENVIVGKSGSPRYNEAINNYREQEGIPDDKDWILNKVMILFPEAKESRGSVEELVKKHNTGRVNHRLCFEKIKHDYEVNGQKRVSWMEVLKVYDGDGFGYVVIVENRPLNTLYAMVEQNVITEDMFIIQFHAYKNELKRLLDQIRGCKGNYEFFHYKDSKLLDFGSAVIAKINKMKLEELN